MTDTQAAEAKGNLVSAILTLWMLNAGVAIFIKLANPLTVEKNPLLAFIIGPFYWLI